MNVLRNSFLMICICLFQLTAMAQTNEDQLLSNNKPADIRVVIDISGSMKLNDPENLRRPALELLVKLFPEEAKAGVWTFGQWVNMLVKHGPVDQAWRASAEAAAKQINSVALHTNIPEALEKAAMNLDKLDPNFSTHMILLTDGMVDVSKSEDENNAARQRIIDEILPKLRAAGITIHTVALSKNADSELMERLAVETNGLTAVAETADDLMKVFLQAFDAAAPAEQLPLEGNAFVVDSSIEEFTALIFKKAGSPPAILVSPDNKQSTADKHDADINWFSEKNYDLITVRTPYEGEWRIIADLEPDSRVTIVSNLSMVVSRLAASMFVGADNDISVLFQEKGKTIRDMDLLSLLDIKVSLTRRDDNKTWSFSLSDEHGVPANGLFTDSMAMLAEAGVYDIVVRADGKSFQREQKQTIAVRETFDIKHSTTDDTPPNHTVTLFAQNPLLDTEGSSVLARVKRPDGSSALKAVSVIADRTWQLALNGVDQTGVYTVTFEATGEYKNGSRFDFTSDSIDITHNVPGSEPIIEEPVAAPPEVIPASKPEPKPPENTEPVAEDTPEKTPEEEGGLGDILLYAGIALGNIIAIALAYFAYKMVMGAGSSSILEDTDEVDVSDIDPAPEEVEASEPEVAPSIDSPPTDKKPIEPVEIVDEEPATEEEQSASEEPDVDVNEELGIDIDDTDIDELADLDDILDLPDDAIDIDSEK